jgi:hypothetical protein
MHISSVCRRRDSLSLDNQCRAEEDEQTHNNVAKAFQHPLLITELTLRSRQGPKKKGSESLYRSYRVINAAFGIDRWALPEIAD